MRFYISGPITGLPPGKAEKLFTDAEKVLIHHGHTYINPERCLRSVELDHDDYLPINMAMLKQCAAIVMLDGWRQSVGACMEIGMAMAMGKRVFYLISEELLEWKY